MCSTVFKLLTTRKNGGIYFTIKDELKEDGMDEEEKNTTFIKSCYKSITLDGNKIHVRLLDNVHDYFDATYIYFVKAVIII